MDYGVVTICLDSAETIHRAMDSVFGQTVPPRQYVVVDGGSTDGTLDILHRTAETAATDHDSVEFAVVNQPAERPGIAAAWNLGLARLTTDLVFLLNSDDWYEPECAETVLAAFDAQPAPDAVLTPVRFWRDSEDPAPQLREPRPLQLLPLLMPVLHPGCFVRRSVYDEVGNFDERYRISADYDFVYRCYRAGVAFGRSNEPLTNMLIGGLAGRSRPLARRETLNVARRHCRLPVLPWTAFALRLLLGR